ncbi:YopX family protein [Paenibacillus sp. EKM211P]|uniref:YopX family protein n=1 Tax=Paenibacillus sp. EKM211P TaxID=1683679 RepID=UPI0013E99E2C|nr:YopX family protein [Paenibacillus sp. EKM211P]KAF6584975.1 hypothetical protein G9G57_07385 [Paenibacillus sp. EKM211P]
MRDIKFRGKRLDNGEWVFGDIWQHNGRVDIVDHRAQSHPVAHETVGQYTGLRDRDNKEIYEGDILKRDWQEHSLEDDIGHVSFQDGGFVLHLPGTVGFDEYLSQYYRGYSASSGTDFYVIGNIHDNPELLQPQGRRR